MRNSLTNIIVAAAMTGCGSTITTDPVEDQDRQTSEEQTEEEAAPEDESDEPDTEGEEDDTLGPVAEVQTGVFVDGETVTLEGVIVASPMTQPGHGFFVQDPGGGDWSGLFIYVGGTGATAEMGDKVDITGTVTEYYDLTELVIADASDISVTGTGSPSSYLLTDTPQDWEVYEGVLVTLDDVTILDQADEFGQVSTDWDIFIDDLFYVPEFTPGEHFSEITGVLTYTYEEWKLGPRDASDLVR